MCSNSIVLFWIFGVLSSYADVLEPKTSIAFVIDNTASMSNDISQVKNGVNSIFHTVLEFNPTQFENFILVTFNDPEVTIRTVTNNPIKFMNELSTITVDGGGDCPELSMKGIYEAVLQSLPGSYVYVFTDATAKDYEDFDKVKDLAQKKSCQIVFILTGVCNSYEDPGYLVYPALAAATSGQVFHLLKNDVQKILNYVAVTVKSRKVVIANKNFESGYEKHFNYTSDRLTDDIVISVSGKNPKVCIIGPHGPVRTDDVVVTPNITMVNEPLSKYLLFPKPACSIFDLIVTYDQIVVVPKQDPGTFMTEVGSMSNTSVVVLGSSNVFFQHGFSAPEPFSLRDTITKPIAGQKSHLAIKLFGGGSDFELKFAELIDSNDKVIMRLPLKLNNVKDRLYITQSFHPPDQPFHIVIKGYDTDTMTQIIRTSATMVEPQVSLTKMFDLKQKTIPKAPTVDLEEAVTVDYGRPVELQCRITAFPEPCVQWEQTDLDIVYRSSVSVVTLPYDYISSYTIDAVTANTTFSCIAYNKYGRDQKQINIITKNMFYFNFISYPNDTTIEYGKDVTFVCDVSAFPPAHIVWYRKGVQIFNDEFTHISENGSVLSIHNVTPKSEGRYSCEALNVYHREVHYFLLSGVQGEEREAENDQETPKFRTSKQTSVDQETILTQKDNNNQDTIFDSKNSVRYDTLFGQKGKLHHENIFVQKENLHHEIHHMQDRLSKLRKEVEDLEYIKKLFNSEKSFLNELKDRVTALEQKIDAPHSVKQHKQHNEHHSSPTKGFRKVIDI